MRGVTGSGTLSCPSRIVLDHVVDVRIFDSFPVCEYHGNIGVTERNLHFQERKINREKERKNQRARKREKEWFSRYLRALFPLLFL